MKKAVRRAQVSLTYNSVDISADVAPYLLSFEYNDVMDGSATDDISITLEDKDGLWLDKWFPERGATIEAGLSCLDWPGGGSMACGSFEIDRIGHGGPPDACSIGAIAVGVSSSLRREKVTKAWEHAPIEQVAWEIARKHGLELEFETDGPGITFDRLDQREQTDMEFLRGLCDNNGLGIHIRNKTLRVFEHLKYDSMAPELRFTRNADGYIGHSLDFSSADVYSACTVQYLEPQQRMLISYTYPSGEEAGEMPAVGQVLKINQRCNSEAEAMVLAKAALRERNKQEIRVSMDFLGDLTVNAGKVAEIEGFGRLDARRYMVERASHRYDKQGGYTTSAEMRGALQY